MPLENGTRLGPYEIVAAIGAGGMGEVYRAHDSRLNRTVAIKVLPPLVASDPDRLRRFEHEARSASALNHPNILTVFDVGDEAGTRYIACELVAGVTLRDRIAKGVLPIDEAIDVATQMAAALAAAHGASVVHRDVKPENVMIRPDGVVKVLDFGLAKLVDDPAAADLATMAARTAAGTIVGTTRYMSPEQARGMAVDTRSDIFSFGLVLYELLAGRPAFEGATATDLLLAIVDREPRPITERRRDTPADLERIVSRCLEKDRERRYRSAEELHADLKRLRASSSARRDAVQTTPSIAVLPFVNMSADPENEYFCDGLAEELISALSRIDRLRVASRTSAFSFKGKGSDMKEIGRVLDVSAVVEGSVRKAGNRLRIAAQLINVADGYQLWSERFDRELDDIFQLQDDIALAIVNALKVKLLGGEKAALAKRHTENAEAHQLYLRGRHHWYKWTDDGFGKSRACMERAIQLDPNYALAYFGLADVYLAQGALGSIRTKALLPEAKAALTRALSLDPELAEAWTLFGVVHLYELDWTAANRAVARAIELNPRLGHTYAVAALVKVLGGHPAEAVEPAARVVELDPLAQPLNFIVAQAYVANGDRSRALEHLRAILEIDPRFWLPHYLRGILILAEGRYREAIQEFEEAVRCSGGASHAVGYLACALALSGDRDRAERELSALAAQESTRLVPPMSFAYGYLGLGMIDRVFDYLERAAEELDIQVLFTLQYDPNFAGIRRDARAAALLRRLGVSRPL